MRESVMLLLLKAFMISYRFFFVHREITKQRNSKQARFKKYDGHVVTAYN